MKKRHTPAETTPARTSFDLTYGEVVCALAQYVESRDETVPRGKRWVWTIGNEAGPRDGNGLLATLVVDHEEEDIDATTGFGSPSPERQTG